jgi:hypothetical protein
MKHLLALSLLVILSFFAPSALAESNAVCHTYTLTDGFERSSVDFWSPWNSSRTGSIRLGETASARRGSNAALLSFGRNEPLGGFLVIDKLFNVGETTVVHRMNHRGCEEGTLPPPPGPTKFCQASAWIRPAGTGASGYVQIIDPSTWTYRVSQRFDVVGRPGWVRVVTPMSTQFCDRDVVARIVLSRDNLTSEATVVDDVTVTWAFGPFCPSC